MCALNSDVTCTDSLTLLQNSNYSFELPSDADEQGQPIAVWVSPAVHLAV